MWVRFIISLKIIHAPFEISGTINLIFFNCCILIRMPRRIANRVRIGHIQASQRIMFLHASYRTLKNIKADCRKNNVHEQIASQVPNC
jgi:hypothetical protein